MLKETHMTTSPPLLRTVLLAAVLCLVGCVYQQKYTKLSYMLNTEYNVFDIKEEPELSFSNFVGYCMMPMKDPGDVRAQEALALIDKFIGENGYIRVATNEIVKNQYVAAKTFLVSFGYVETFTEGTIEVVLNLHAANPAHRNDVVFWSWQAEYEEYPLEKATIEPALTDIFKKEPLDWSRKDRLFPLLCAPSNMVQTFTYELERARGAK